MAEVDANLTDGIKWYVAFVLSTSFHEAAHAWTAHKLGDDTAFNRGLVTADPTPHIKRSPWGMVLVPILSYALGGWMIGWASAPFSIKWAEAFPKRAALMSLAGPASNLLVCIAAGILMRIGLSAHVFDRADYPGFSSVVVPAAPGVWLFLAKILSIFFSLNVLLAVFNLLPLPPLDGSGIILFFATKSYAATIFQFTRAPMFTLIGMSVAWRLIGKIMPDIQRFATGLLLH